jgi:hypothetical protein
MSFSCPWALTDIDLRDPILTFDQKRWFAMAYLQGHFTVKESHHKYKLSIDILYIYIRRVRLGDPVPGKNGPPRKLDG